MDEWTTNVKNSNLPPRLVWLSYEAQLWAGLKYGVGTTSATLEQLENKKVNGKEDGLGTRDHKILSRLGICRSCDVPWRYIPASHGGMELKNLTAEATAASLNLFLQHYGTDTSLGTYLTTTIENLQLELGVTGCPFQYDYSVWNGLATDSWIKSLWERIDKFDLFLELDYNTLDLPRENDRPIMEWLVREGYRAQNSRQSTTCGSTKRPYSCRILPPQAGAQLIGLTSGTGTTH